jgi:hypothetical protein
MHPLFQSTLRIPKRIPAILEKLEQSPEAYGSTGTNKKAIVVFLREIEPEMPEEATAGDLLRLMKARDISKRFRGKKERFTLRRIITHGMHAACSATEKAPIIKDMRKRYPRCPTVLLFETWLMVQVKEFLGWK